MPHTLYLRKRPSSVSFFEFLRPALDAMENMPDLQPKGNRPLKMSFEEHLRALVFFHLEVLNSVQ